ncbi:MAG: hypothetical protein IT379_30570 [Deltaproteobacteria bacterium]|nr:hypothetical protein [Deltaproteobacteria bacterium]
MESLKAGDLVIEVLQALPPEPLRLVWRGKSNERNPSILLAPFFARSIEEASQRGVAIEMHFEALDHFNSSTITALIQLIQDARRRGIGLVIVYDASVKWQRLSFEALRVFSKGDGLLELRARAAAEPAA